MRRISRNGYRCEASVRIYNLKDVINVYGLLLRAGGKRVWTEPTQGDHGWTLGGEFHELNAALETADVNKRHHERRLKRCS